MPNRVLVAAAAGERLEPAGDGPVLMLRGGQRVLRGSLGVNNRRVSFCWGSRQTYYDSTRGPAAVGCRRWYSSSRRKRAAGVTV